MFTCELKEFKIRFCQRMLGRGLSSAGNKGTASFPRSSQDLLPKMIIRGSMHAIRDAAKCSWDVINLYCLDKILA